MKKLSKRTKMLVAIAAVVLVVVVVVIGFAEGGSPLHGTSAYVITPENPTVEQGATVTLCIPGQARWSSENPKVAAVAEGNNAQLVDCIEVQGVAAGQTTITAKVSPYGFTETQTIVAVR
jgi:hypothetical protein